MVNLSLIQTGDNDMLVSWVEPDGVVDGYRVCQDHLDTDTAPGSKFPSDCVDVTAPDIQTTLRGLSRGHSVRFWAPVGFAC